MLPLPPPFEDLEPIPGRRPKIIEDSRLIEQTKLPQRRSLDIGRQSTAPSTGPDDGGLRAGEALYHVQL